MGLFKRSARSKRLEPLPPRAMRFGAEELTVSIRRYAKARSMRLRVDPAARVLRISIPNWTMEGEALALARQHEAWILYQLQNAPQRHHLAHGEYMSFRGADYLIQWQQGHPRKPELDAACVRIGGPRENLEKRLVSWLKSEARKAFEHDIAFYCEKAGCAVPPVALSDARTRWGSCSSSSGIRLNWRLIMAPDHVRRSVAAHEVAHLKHMDHSARFYTHLTALFEGELAVADAWLKRHGAALRSVGLG